MGKEKILLGAAALMASSTLKNKRQVSKKKNNYHVNEISSDLYQGIVEFKNLIRTKFPDHELVLVGSREGLFRDIGAFYECLDLSKYSLKDFKNKNFKKLEEEDMLNNFNSEEQELIKGINILTRMKKIRGVSGARINGRRNGKILFLGNHELALIPKNDNVINLLEMVGYGEDVIFQYTDSNRDCKLFVKLVAYKSWYKKASSSVSKSTSSATKTAESTVNKAGSTTSDVINQTGDTLDQTGDAIESGTQVIIGETSTIVDNSQQTINDTIEKTQDQLQNIGQDVKNTVNSVYKKLEKDYKDFENKITKMAKDIEEALKNLECSACKVSVTTALSVTITLSEGGEEFILNLIIRELLYNVGTEVACEELTPYLQQFLHEYLKNDIVDTCLASIICSIISDLGTGNLMTNTLVTYLADYICWINKSGCKEPICP